MNIVVKCILRLHSEMVTPENTGYQKVIPPKIANTAPIERT